MRSSRRFALVLLGPLLLAARAVGQEPTRSQPLVRPGMIVRITVDAQKPLIGTVSYLRGDTLAVQERQLAFLYRTVLDSVTSLDVQVGRHSNFGRYTLHGALIGGGIGAVIGVIGALTENDQDSFVDYDAGVLIAGFTGTGLVLGGAIGALAGAGSYRPIWQPVSVSSLRAGVGTGPGEGARFQMGVTIPLRL